MSPQGEIKSAIPDLGNISLAQLPGLKAETVLAHSIKMYRQRLKETGLPLSSFNASIS
jgi:hypothetical protein